MPWNRLAVIVGLCGSLAFVRGARAAQEQVGPWTVVSDNDARIVSMSYLNPPTALASIKMLEIDLGSNAKATHGRIEYKDGVKRDMSKEEVHYYYYELLEGPKAAWDYLAAKDQVIKYAPATHPLPTSLAGNSVRVITQKGGNYFGTLGFESDAPRGFTLTIDRSSKVPIWFDNAMVREVQVAK